MKKYIQTDKLQSMIDWENIIKMERDTGGHDEQMMGLFKNAELIGHWNEGNYQGMVATCVKLENGKCAIYNDFYGSCSGCDSWINASDEGVRNMCIDLSNGAYVFESLEDVKEFLSKDDRNFDWNDCREGLLEAINKMTLQEFSREYIDLFGDNAKVMLSLIPAFLFKDVLNERNIKLPIIYCQGKQGTGKTTFATLFTKLFEQEFLSHIDTKNTSKINTLKAIASRKLKPIILDNYVEKESINETLKCSYDGVRKSLIIDTQEWYLGDLKESSIVFCGQKQIKDMSLKARCCVLEFDYYKFTLEEQETLFDFLNKLSKTDITNITEELKRHKQFFSDNISFAYKSAIDELKGLAKAYTEREIRNWAVPLACLNVMLAKVELPFTWDDMIYICSKKIDGLIF